MTWSSLDCICLTCHKSLQQSCPRILLSHPHESGTAVLKDIVHRKVNVATLYYRRFNSDSLLSKSVFILVVLKYKTAHPCNIGQYLNHKAHNWIRKQNLV